MLTDELTADQLGLLLGAAAAAPRLNGTPDLQYDVNGHLIDVYRDPAQPPRHGEPARRALRISAGAAAFNIRCAAAAISYDSWVSLAPYPQEPDLLTRIVVEPTGIPDRRLRDLSAAIWRQGSPPLPEQTEPLSQDVRIDLIRAAYAEDADLTWLSPAQLHAVLDLLGQSGAHPHPPTAVLATDRDDMSDQLAAGLALQRILLTAARANHVSALPRLLTSEDHRHSIQDLIGKPGVGQLLIRFGGARIGRPDR